MLKLLTHSEAASCRHRITVKQSLTPTAYMTQLNYCCAVMRIGLLLTPISGTCGAVDEREASSDLHFVKCFLLTLDTDRWLSTSRAIDASKVCMPDTLDVANASMAHGLPLGPC